MPSSGKINLAPPGLEMPDQCQKSDKLGKSTIAFHPYRKIAYGHRPEWGHSGRGSCFFDLNLPTRKFISQELVRQICELRSFAFFQGNMGVEFVIF
jgi:hypothetical protein